MLGPGAPSAIEIIEFAGVAVFAASGAIAAGRKNLDVLGMAVIATVTAIGGGTLRDLLLDRPVVWVTRSGYLWVILGAALATIAYTRRFHPPERLLAVLDACGLALFTISGAQIAEDSGHEGIVVVLMGTLTGVAGGVIRDVLTGQIPLIFQKGQIYATAAIVGAVVYLMMQSVFDRTAAALAGMACIAALRLGAIALNWTLPVFPVPGDRP